MRQNPYIRIPAIAPTLQYQKTEVATRVKQAWAAQPINIPTYYQYLTNKEGAKENEFQKPSVTIFSKTSCFLSSHDNNLIETYSLLLAWRDLGLFLSEAKTSETIIWFKPRSRTFTPFHRFRRLPTRNKGRLSRRGLSQLYAIQTLQEHQLAAPCCRIQEVILNNERGVRALLFVQGGPGTRFWNLKGRGDGAATSARRTAGGSYRRRSKPPRVQLPPGDTDVRTVLAGTWKKSLAGNKARVFATAPTQPSN